MQEQEQDVIKFKVGVQTNQREMKIQKEILPLLMKFKVGEIFQRNLHDLLVFKYSIENAICWY